jgi:hypothetical protein
MGRPRKSEEVRGRRRAHRWRPNQLSHSRAAERRRHGLGLAKTVRGYGKVETTQLHAEKDVASAMELVSGLPRLA